MTTYYVSTSGDNSDGLTWATAYNDIDTALGNSNADSNVIILDDEAHVISTIPAGADWRYTQTMQSRSGNPETCSVTTASATAQLFNMNLGANAGAWTFQNIAFTRNTALTADESLIAITGSFLTAVTFEGCIFGDFNITSSGATDLNGAFIRNQTTTRTVTFTNTTFRNVTATYSVGYGTLIRMAAGADFIMDGCTWSNISRTIAATDGTGLIYGESANGSLTIKGNTKFTNITQSGDETNMILRPIIHSSITTFEFHFDGVVLNNLTRSGANTANGIFAYISGPFSVENITATNCTNTIGTSATYGGDGGVFYQNNVTAVGKFRNISVSNIESRSGAAIFSSNGAHLDCEGIKADSCVCDIGVIYSGHNGDCLISGAEITNASSSASAQNRDGLAIFARLNPAIAARDKVVDIGNCTLLNNVNIATFTDGIHIQNDHADTVNGTIVANVYNVISRNGGETALEIVGTGTGTITTTTHNCNVEGGATATSVDTNNDITSADPGLDGNNVPQAGSAMLGGGIKWWDTSTLNTANSNPQGANGEPFSDIDTDVGGNQSTLGSFHPVNL